MRFFLILFFVANNCLFANNRSNQMNPNNDAYWQSRGYDSRPNNWDNRSQKSNLDNRSNQLNPNNSAYWRSRDYKDRPSNWEVDRENASVEIMTNEPVKSSYRRGRRSSLSSSIDFDQNQRLACVPQNDTQNAQIDNNVSIDNEKIKFLMSTIGQLSDEEIQGLVWLILFCLFLFCVIWWVFSSRRAKLTKVYKFSTIVLEDRIIEVISELLKQQFRKVKIKKLRGGCYQFTGKLNTKILSSIITITGYIRLQNKNGQTKMMLDFTPNKNGMFWLDLIFFFLLNWTLLSVIFIIYMSQKSFFSKCCQTMLEHLEFEFGSN